MIKRLSNHFKDSNRWKYLLRSVSGSLKPSRKSCPNCGGKSDQSVGRKLLVTQLVRCRDCKLLYRTPTDPESFGDEFYQDDYSQGFTTDCPSDQELAKQVQSSFKDTPKDFTDKIKLFEALGVVPGARVLDFGASWGYGTWQFSQAGYDVLGFETGRSRARYAREKLDVDVVTETQAIDKAASTKKFDLIFSSHVLEHVPRPSEIISQAESWLRPGGVFVAYTPNGSFPYRDVDPIGYHNHWGMVHPNYLDDRFYQQAMSANWKCLITGTPVDVGAIERWDRTSDTTQLLDSWELLVIGIRN